MPAITSPWLHACHPGRGARGRTAACAWGAAHRSRSRGAGFVSGRRSPECHATVIGLGRQDHSIAARQDGTGCPWFERLSGCAGTAVRLASPAL